MKIACICGESIIDRTDNLPNKAHFIADQDFFYLLDEANKAIMQSGTTTEERKKTSQDFQVLLIAKLMKSIYQCLHCGRIYFEKDKNDSILEQYTKAEPYKGKSILSSTQLEK